MRIQFIIVSLTLLSSIVFGQSKKECQQVLNKEISATTLNENIDEFLIDFKTLIGCEFDEIDYQIFMGPQANMPFIANTFVTMAGKIENEDKYTFEDLKQTLLSFKENPEYSKARNIVEAKNTLINKSALIENWKIDDKLFERMGFTETEREEIYAIVNENENKPYAEIFIIYSEILRAKKEKELNENQNKLDRLKSKNPEKIEWVKGLYAYKDYVIGLTKSKELNRPILLYFNAYACASSRRIESEILLKTEIQEYINNNLIFVSLIVDEKTRLEENKIYFSQTLNKEVKNSGQINLELEMKEFHSESQPLFVLLDMNGNEISRIGYTNDLEEFNSFLRTIEK